MDKDISYIRLPSEQAVYGVKMLFDKETSG